MTFLGKLCLVLTVPVSRTPVFSPVSRIQDRFYLLTSLESRPFRGGSGGRRGERPVDVKENGIGGVAADSEPVAQSATPAAARGTHPP